MKILYFECNMGAAGDMLMSALCELVPNPNEFICKMNELNIPNVKFELKKDIKCGIVGTHISVTVDGAEEGENMHEHIHEHSHDHSHTHENEYDEHTHTHDHTHDHEHNQNNEDTHEHNHEHHHHHEHHNMTDIENIIIGLAVSENVKQNALAVYRLIAEAESKAHNKEIENIHFHEVGSMDAVADVVGVCVLMEEIGADSIVVSPVNVGSGFVKCAHGILPVPVPATATILQGVPIYSGNIESELCTPTGAALLKHFAQSFGKMPVMNVQKIGYGLGNKNFEIANCVRVFLGEISNLTDEIIELKCNIDDMTGERLAFATERLLENKALDVFVTPIYMKKGRPANLLTVICNKADKDNLVSLIFKHTTTLGIRENICKRYVLDREEKFVNTKYGDARVKISEGYGVKRIKPEYDDAKEIALRENIDISTVVKEIVHSVK